MKWTVMIQGLKLLLLLLLLSSCKEEFRGPKVYLSGEYMCHCIPSLDSNNLCHIHAQAVNNIQIIKPVITTVKGEVSPEKFVFICESL